MVWLAQSPDLNCIENLWGLAKQQLYANNKQYGSKPELKAAIERILTDIEESTIQKMTSSMEARILKVVKANGEYIKMLKREFSIHIVLIKLFHYKTRIISILGLLFRQLCWV